MRTQHAGVLDFLAEDNNSPRFSGHRIRLLRMTYILLLCTCLHACTPTSTSDLISLSVIVWTASPTLLPGRLSVTAKIVAATEPSTAPPPPPPPPPKGGFKPSVAFLR